PFCGIILGLTFLVNLRGWLRWVLSFVSPLAWITSIIFLVSQLPAKDYLLLIAAIMISLPFTLLYYISLVILMVANIKDWFTQTIKQRLQYQQEYEYQRKLLRQDSTQQAQPLPSNQQHDLVT